MSENNSIIEVLKKDGVAVIPTDTIYGLVGRALSLSVVNKIDSLKVRSSDKPFIILISSLSDLDLFDIKLNKTDRNILTKIWPNKISIVLPCNKESLEYLHKGKNSLAFRIPLNNNLLKIIKETGPLIAPSANPENQPPAENTDEAKIYFGDDVDIYIEGKTNKTPSTLISLENGKIKILREGSITLEEILEKIK